MRTTHAITVSRTDGQDTEIVVEVDDGFVTMQIGNRAMAIVLEAGDISDLQRVLGIADGKVTR